MLNLGVQTGIVSSYESMGKEDWRCCLQAGTLEMNFINDGAHDTMTWVFKHWRDGICGLLIGVSVFCLTWCYLGTVSRQFYYPNHALMSMIYPAVFFAAGHGMGTTDIEQFPGLPEFIYGKSNHFDVQSLPERVELVPLRSPLALSHLYYLYAIGWTWRIFGVSESALQGYSAFLRAISALLLFFLCRFALSRKAAVFAVVLVSTSPAMLYAGITLRDFGKMPFILAVLLVLVAFFVRVITVRKLLFLSGLLGIIFGVGVGFRQDLLILLPLAVFVIVFLIRLQVKRQILYRVGAAGLLFLVFLPISRPLFQGVALEGGQTSVHTILSGMSKVVEADLQFGGDYTLLPQSYSAEAVNYAVLNTFARRSGVQDSMVNPNSAEYQRFMGDESVNVLVDPYFFFNGTAYAEAGQAYLKDLLYVFPADFVARAWRAVAAAFTVPAYYHKAAAGRDSERPAWVRALFYGHGLLARHVAHFGLVYVGAALLMLAAVQFRAALFFTALFLWLFGYPSLQFEYRHLFHLAFVPIVAGTFVFEQAGGRLLKMMRKKAPLLPPHLSQNVLRMTALAGLVALIFLGPLLVLRIWQFRQVHSLAERLTQAPRESVAVSAEIQGETIQVRPRETLPGLTNASHLPPGETAWAYVAIVFDTHGYDIPVTIHYDDTRILNNFTQSITLRGICDDFYGTSVFYFPIYETDTTYSMGMASDLLRTFPHIAEALGDSRPLPQQDWWRRSRFIGISFPELFSAVFNGLYVVKEINDVSLLPLIQIPKDRAFLRTCKTGPWETCIREQFGKQAGESACSGGDPLDNSIWELDEALLYHPPSPLFSRPLFCLDQAERYVSSWRVRVSSMPVSSYAALDLANAGTQWLHEERLEEAVQAYQAACKFAPENALYPVRLGQVLEKSGSSRAAMASYCRALEITPMLPDTLERLEGLFLSEDAPEQYLQFLRGVFEKYPENWLIGMRLGSQLEAEGTFEEATQVYETLITFHSAHPDLQLALARCYMHIQRFEDAFQLIKMAMEEHASHQALGISHFDALGQLLLDQSNYEAAGKVFQHLTEVDEANPTWLVYLGDTQRAEGREEGAVRSYQSALTLMSEEQAPLRELVESRLESCSLPEAKE